MGAIDLKEIDIADIEANTRPYRNALDHRNFVVEGIRQIAFRNMMHLTNAMRHCGISNPGGDLSEDRLIRVQGKMLKDQGLENSQGNRNVLALGTYYPVQIYLTLLYAGIEFYDTNARKLELYKDRDYGDCLDHNKMTVLRLKDFRDSFLHPSQVSFSREELFLKTPMSYHVAPRLQQEFDDYLYRAREKILKFLFDSMANLPEIQRLCCIGRFHLVNMGRMQIHNDTVGVKHLENGMEDLSRRINNMPESARSWSPDQKQAKIANRLAQCLDDVSPSIPEQQYMPSGDKQTPLPPQAILGVTEDREPICLDRSHKHEAHVIKDRIFYERLVVSARILRNEVMDEIHKTRQIVKQEMSNSRLAGETEAEGALKHLVGGYVAILNERGEKHRIERIAAPLRVAMALIYEPLRVYRTASEQNFRIKNDHIDSYLSRPGRLEALRKHRNSVFHVQTVKFDPVEVDLMMTDPERESAFANPHVLGELHRFFNGANAVSG